MYLKKIIEDCLSIFPFFVFFFLALWQKILLEKKLSNFQDSSQFLVFYDLFMCVFFL